MKVLMQSMRRLLDSPYVSLAVGVLMLIGGLTDIWDTLGEDLLTLRLRGLHGVAIFGLVKGLHAILECFDGLDRINRSNQQR